MPTLRYIGPIDEVDVVGVGIFKRGDEFEATADQAKSLLDQPDNFARKGPSKPRKPRKPRAAKKTAPAPPPAVDDVTAEGV